MCAWAAASFMIGGKSASELQGSRNLLKSSRILNQMAFTSCSCLAHHSLARSRLHGLQWFGNMCCLHVTYRARACPSHLSISPVILCCLCICWMLSADCCSGCSCSGSLLRPRLQSCSPSLPSEPRQIQRKSGAGLADRLRPCRRNAHPPGLSSRPE